MMKPSKRLDRLVALTMGLIEGVDFGNLGQHNWEWNEYSEYNQYICKKCDKDSENWADESKLPLEGCYKSPPMYSTTSFYIEELVRKFRLVVRPSVLNDRWVAGRFERVYLDGKIEVSNEVTGNTIPHAIALAVIAAKEPAKK